MKILALGLPDTCMRHMYMFAERACDDTIDCCCDEDLESNFCRMNRRVHKHRFKCSWRFSQYEFSCSAMFACDRLEGLGGKRDGFGVALAALPDGFAKVFRVVANLLIKDIAKPK